MRGQFLRFALAGGIGFIVDASVLYAMLWAGAGPYLGRAVSFLCAVLVTWQINRRLTFTDRHGKSIFREFAEYLLAMLAGGLCNYAAYAVALHFLPAGKTTPLIADAFGSIAGMLVNFASAKLWVFRARPTRDQ
jgi:putative flippase GtrA